MDEKKTDPSGYEPNFVMQDAAESEAAENQPDMAENQSDMPEDPAKAAAPPGDQEDFAQEAAPGASNDFEKKEHSAIRGRLFATQNPARALISIMSTIVPVR